MITHILALMLMLDATQAPQLLVPFTSKEECMAAAEKATKEDGRLRTAHAQAMQVEYVCLAVIRITV